MMNINLVLDDNQSMLKSSLRIHAVARRNYLGFGCWMSEVKKHSDWIYANRAEEMN